MPTSSFVIVAAMRARAEKTDALRAALLALVAPTRAEAGCIQYDLHQDQKDPAAFLFYEIWRTREEWLVHMETAHLQTFRAQADSLLDGPLQLWEMNQIEP